LHKKTYKTFLRAVEAMLEKVPVGDIVGEAQAWFEEPSGRSKSESLKIANWLRRRESLARMLDPQLTSFAQRPIEGASPNVHSEAKRWARALILESVKYVGKEPTKRDVEKIYAGALYVEGVKPTEICRSMKVTKNTLRTWRNLAENYKAHYYGMAP
jgi:hypothetical protein